jgi:hypothetical protein
MKAYFLVVLTFLLVGQLTLSDEPSKYPNLALSLASEKSKTEAGQPSTSQFCLDCGSGVNHPSKPLDDQETILKNLDRSDRETVVQQAARKSL